MALPSRRVALVAALLVAGAATAFALGGSRNVKAYSASSWSAAASRPRFLLPSAADADARAAAAGQGRQGAHREGASPRSSRSAHLPALCARCAALRTPLCTLRTTAPDAPRSAAVSSMPPGAATARSWRRLGISWAMPMARTRASPSARWTARCSRTSAPPPRCALCNSAAAALEPKAVRAGRRCAPEAIRAFLSALRARALL